MIQLEELANTNTNSHLYLVGYEYLLKVNIKTNCGLRMLPLLM